MDHPSEATSPAIDVGTARPAPWYFTLARRMHRLHVRGSTRFEQMLESRGLIPEHVYYTLPRGIRFTVPVRRHANRMDRKEVLRRGRLGIQQFAKACSELDPPVRLIDCGADIGIVSVQMAIACESIAEVVAFEPNDRAYPYLEANLAALPFRATAHHGGVGDFSGRGRLVESPDDPGSDHARFVEPDDDGPIRVMRVDDLDLDRPMSLALKIDVEGLELPVLRGAEQAIRDAPGCVVILEAHRDVVARTGIDPIEFVTFLQGLRPFRPLVCELPNQTIDLDIPFFEQPFLQPYRQRTTWNLLLTTSV